MSQYYNRHGLNWTEAEKNKLVQLFKQGRSIDDIATEIGRRQDAIVHKLLEIGVVGFPDDGYPRRYGFKWGPSELRNLAQEFAAGRSIEEIAIKHERTRDSILHTAITQQLFDITDRNELLKYTSNSKSAIKSVIESSPANVPTYSSSIQNGYNMDKPERPGREIDYTAPRGVEIPKFDIVNESLWDVVSGRGGKAEWRINVTTFQQKLERTWDVFDKSITGQDGADLGLIKGFDEFKETQMGIPEAESNAANLKEEWNESLTSLSNLLTKIQGEEIRLWDITQGNRINRSMKIKQKIIRTGIDEMNFNNMVDKIDTYPKLQSSAVVEKAIERLDAKRKEAQEAGELYNRRLKQANIYLNTAGRRIQQAETELSTFEKTLKRFKKEVENPPKRLFGLLPAISKIEVLVRSKIIEPYDDKIDTMNGQLKLIKNDLKEYKERRFRPIVTQKFAAIED